jgi:poly(A) polymerase
VVGRAYKFLLEERMEHGPLDPAVAESRLRDWWAAQPEAAPAGAELSTTEES